MFRNTIIGATILAWSGAALAAADSKAPPAASTSGAAPGVRILDTKRYVQTKLDWRSYYLNRLSAPRHTDRPGRPVPPQADVGSGS